MVFSSLTFLFQFLPVTLLLYYVVPRGWKNAILLAASLFFYAWGEPVYLFLMLFSILINYGFGGLTAKATEAGRKGRARGIVAASIVINLLLLGYFKYADFLIGTVNNLFGAGLAPIGVALPIGISFYTFQSLSYPIDIYRGAAKPQKNLLDFGTYVALFPQLIAGPIVQYHTLALELRQREETLDGFAQGIQRFLCGLAKKVLLANNLGLLWNEVSAQPAASLAAGTAWLGILAFAFQIYFDFSGYSDMAVGLGRMFGFHFPENFNYPYLSQSVTEFWRRWHISLSSWFRDYVYIPLGGNRHGLGRQICNILTVWVLTGIWHGASWNFLLWGLYFGILLILEKCFLLRVLEKLPAFVRWLWTSLLLLLGWVIFAFDSLPDGLAYFQAMLPHSGMDGGLGLYLLLGNAVLLVLAALASINLPAKLFSMCLARAEQAGLAARLLFCAVQNLGMILLFLLCVAYLVDASYNPFLYFRF